MTESIQLPSEEVMRQMAKIAIEKATEDMAVLAVKMAGEMRHGELPMPTGADALESWAKAIRSNNERHYGLMGEGPDS